MFLLMIHRIVAEQQGHNGRGSASGTKHIQG